MEPTQLQLVLNVVTITGMTTLAGYCYLLKKENRKLASERKADPNVACNKEVIATAPAAKPVAVIETDIRRFAAGRRTGWVNTMASVVSAQG